MTMIGWVAAHTGMPSLRVTGPATVRTWDRILTVVPAGGDVLMSDALAEPGVPTEYADGSTTVTLTRRADGARYALLTDLTGRGVGGLWYRDLGDPESWKSDAYRYPDGGVRYAETPTMREGSGRFILWDPTREAAMWDLVRARTPLVVSAAAQVPGASRLRVVTVDQVSRQRLTPQGAQTWDVQWIEYPADQVTGAAPVVTWGEWQAYGDAHPSTPGWQHVSALDLAQVIGGMPA
mgnify:CR=1 FL=1